MANAIDLKDRIAVVTGGALVRNMLICTAMALVPAVIHRAELAWLPPLVYVGACAQLGATGDGTDYYWWAAVLAPSASRASLTVAAVMLLASLTAYALWGGALPRWRRA